MLPNLRILICGVVFGPLLFAVTGAGIFLPDSNTRVGEMPEISRPMMQRVIAEEPAQAQFHIMRLARRSEELERLRERAAIEVPAVFAPESPAPDLAKPAAIESPVFDNPPATDTPGTDARAADLPATGTRAAYTGAPILQPPAAAGIMPETALSSLETRQPDVAADEAGPAEVAALPPTSAGADQTERTPNLTTVPLPPLRPGIGRSDIHKQALRRKRSTIQAPSPSNDTFGQVLLRSGF